MSDDGATKAPLTDENKNGECMGRWKHATHWLAMNSHPRWATRARCSTCGQVWEVDLATGKHTPVEKGK